ncbi:methionine aminopeptidase, type I [Kwoniella shandongensis]|uniref:Methionine aminopeptidase n=1 Tax=Kwoniella shandongensis TaxID=1734106 RepID=A0A5M6C6Q5_9TREE|nr:methionine aminopeptidase, type I [Kwoniella shandongensis]KAA5530370.1 methionine aminopeptidase, type I [Kwoniella shandongensis]
MSRIQVPRSLSRIRRYHTLPSRFGTYPLLHPSSALTSYPTPLPVPTTIPRPSYVPKNFFTAPWGEHDAPESDTDDVELRGERIKLGSEGEKRVREVARLASEVLKEVGKLVKPGITTSELDRAAHEMIKSRGAYPSPLGYSSFPRSCTTSVNNVIAHGIPDDRPLHPQDLINIDLTLFFQGYHGDTSATFLLPDVDKLGRELVEATKEALEVGIRVCGPGKPYSEIGRAIEEFAKRYGFSVNSQFSGHGIGKRFHQPPWIFHTRNSEPGTMLPGDCFTIEPCLVQGSNSRGDLWDDGWTMSTETGARSAQFEHQILITHDGAEILT